MALVEGQDRVLTHWRVRFVQVPTLRKERMKTFPVLNFQFFGLGLD